MENWNVLSNVSIVIGMVVYWGLVFYSLYAWLKGKGELENLISDKMFCRLAMAGVILHMIIFLIPHSINAQY